MKHVCATYLFLIFSLATQVAWGQVPDSISRPVDSTRYKTVVSDRLNEVDERERGPSISKLMKKADENFGKKNFYAAMKYYSFVLKPEPLNPEALKGYGESAFAIASLDSAEAAFQRMVDRGINPPDHYPKMRLADVKFRKGDYDEALVLYDEIATMPQNPPIPNNLIKIAKYQRDLCLWAQEDGTKNPYSIKNATCIRDTCYRLDTANVSTVDYSEYVAYPYQGQLYFSAYRFDLKKDRENPKRNTVKLLKADGADKVLGPSQKMVVTPWEFNDVKRQHTAHLTYNKAHDAVYYALGDFVHDSADIRFDLYRRKKNPLDTTWSLPEKLTVNMAGFTNTEPSIGTLPGEHFETLFFVSDRPDDNGKGDKNIWFSKIINDSLTAPKLLDSLNTAGNDVTPFYHQASNTLFYSTDGLKTLGGLDVYKSRLGSKGYWTTPVHMGPHVNSSANDAFFVLEDQSGRGFFSSNRNGNINYSEEGCCYDIFYVDFMVKYKALALHDLTKQILPYTSITLYEQRGNGQLVKVNNPMPDSFSTFYFDVKLGNKYALIGEKDGFISDTLLDIITPDELWKGEIVDTLYLRPRINLVARVWDCETDAPIFGATAKFFNLTKPENNTTNILSSNSNTQSYKIDFEERYQVVMEKKGYRSPDTSEIVSTVGRIEGGTLYVDLRLRRPDPFANFEKIALYFDNDFPKRTAWTDDSLVNATSPDLVEMRNALSKNRKDPLYQDSVLINYQQTFTDYARRYRDLFIPEYIKGLTGHKRIEDSLLLSNFFENEARANFGRFRDFFEKLDTILQQGDTIEIEIQGYASPLANPDYNLHLTNRRTASVYNMFVTYDAGYFKYRPFPGRPGEFLGYYKPDNSGQLKFKRIPNGEDASVYKDPAAEDPRNPRASIYDVRASRERRVEITGVKILKSKCKT